MSTGSNVEVLLTKQEASDLTAKIRAYAASTYLLVKQAYDGHAHRALGYATWTDYLHTEFDISKSQGYRLIAHARVLEELAGAAGLESGDVSPMGDIPERVTRDLDAAAVAAGVASKVAAEPDADEQRRAEIVDETITEHTTKVTERTTTNVDAETGEILPPPATPIASGEPGDADTDPVGGSVSEGSGPAPAAETEAETEAAEPSALDVLIAAGSARKKAWDLFKQDPAALAEACDLEATQSWLGTFRDWRQFMDAFEAASTPRLRSVQ